MPEPVAALATQQPVGKYLEQDVKTLGVEDRAGGGFVDVCCDARLNRYQIPPNRHGVTAWQKIPPDCT